MKCESCQGRICEYRATLVLQSKMLGDVAVPDVLQRECTHCGERTVSAAAGKAAAAYVSAQERKRIGALPIDSFVTLNEAAALLGVSKQAFHQNRRIARGFIYLLKKADRIFYYEPSVRAFAQSGDGRIPLTDGTGAAPTPGRVVPLAKRGTKKSGSSATEGAAQPRRASAKKSR